MRSLLRRVAYQGVRTMCGAESTAESEIGVMVSPSAGLQVRGEVRHVPVPGVWGRKQREGQGKGLVWLCEGGGGFKIPDETFNIIR